MKKVLSLLLALALCFSLCACGAANSNADTSASAAAIPEHDPADGYTSAATSEADSADISVPMHFEVQPDEALVHRTFAYSVAANSVPSETAVVQGLKTYLELRGDTLVETQDADDATAQNETLKMLAAQKLDAVFVSPIEPEALTEGLKALSDAGIAVFGFGSWGENVPDTVVATYGFDEYNAGFVCGTDLSQRCDKGGDVLLVYEAGSDSMETRADGFIDACIESGVPLEILDSDIDTNRTQDQTELAEQITKELEENPNIVGIFCSSDKDALVAASVVEQAKRNCWVYGGDGSPELKAKLGQSQVAGIGAQSPATLVQIMVDYTNQYLDGEDITAQNIVSTFLITQSNVAQYGTTDWQ